MMCNFSLNNCSLVNQVKYLDVSLNAICVKLTHNLSFENYLGLLSKVGPCLG